MDTKELKYFYTEYSSLDELSPDDRDLVGEAVDALEGAYAPYSLFRVGAALRLENGSIVRGSNQENVAFPSGLCAERSALFAAGSQFPNSTINAMAVIASPHSFVLRDPVTPCGACRQVISEYEHKQESPIRILLHHPDGRTWEFSGVEILLPLGFQESSLKK